jgi:hypothetical protein
MISASRAEIVAVAVNHCRHWTSAATAVARGVVGGRILLDRHGESGYFRPSLGSKLGRFLLNPARWILVFLLLGTVVCAFTVPPIDNPETAFNEADAPVSLALPTSLWARVVLPAADSITLPKLPLKWAVAELTLSEERSLLAPKQPSQDSLQKLLCTFLI